jgi:hypothetical protein
MTLIEGTLLRLQKLAYMHTRVLERLAMVQAVSA